MQQQPVASPSVTGVSDVTGAVGWDPLSLPITRKCMFFTARHLMRYWVNHAQIAKEKIEGMALGDGCR